MGSKDHVAGSVGDAIVGVGRNVVQKLVDGGVCGLGGGGLFGADGGEGDEELVVHGTGIVEEDVDDALDLPDAVLVEGRAHVGLHDEPLAPVLDGLALVGRELALARPGVVVLEEQLGKCA